MLNYRREHFLGFEVELDLFREDFYWIFTEVFIEESYYFHSDKEDPSIVDCGGNIGISVLYFKTIYPEAKILVFEPSPDNVAILKRNIERNNITGIQIIEEALGDTEGEIILFRQGPGSTIHEDFARKQKVVSSEGYGEEVRVPMRTLSSYVAGPIDFLKLDVEGAEGAILKNLDESGLMRNIVELAMEYHAFSPEINTLSSIAGVLERNGFQYLCGGEAHNMSEAPKSTYKSFMLFARRTAQPVNV